MTTGTSRTAPHSPVRHRRRVHLIGPALAVVLIAGACGTDGVTDTAAGSADGSATTAPVAGGEEDRGESSPDEPDGDDGAPAEGADPNPDPDLESREDGGEHGGERSGGTGGESGDDGPTGSDDGEGDAMEPADGANDGGGPGSGRAPERTVSNDDVLSPNPADIDQVIELDDRTPGVRFWSAAEPCARSRVSVAETADAVELTLETGLHPNAAAMTCIAGEFYYEIAVELDEPVGDRSILPVPARSDGTGDGLDDKGATGVTGDYVGLSEDDARALATSQGRDFRVERRDAELMALTMDYMPDRVNVEVDDGEVTAARMG